MHAHGIPDAFPSRARRRPTAAKPPTLAGPRGSARTCRSSPSIPSDARDHDDAVCAEPDPDPKNTGGWVVIVAIADVAALCAARHARSTARRSKRGNSVYFPDRVVPMLPERISNDLCSLREGEDARLPRRAHGLRQATAARRGHRFLRAMMRSAAKLSYEEAQAAIDGQPRRDDRAAARDRAEAALGAPMRRSTRRATERAPLDLDLPERKIVLDDEGRVERVDHARAGSRRTA